MNKIYKKISIYLYSNSILTKEELTYYQNLRNVWLELNYLLRNPPENINYTDLDSATKLFTAVTEAKQILDELDKYVNSSSKGVFTTIQRYLRSTIALRFWPYLPAIICGDTTPFAKLLNKMAIKLSEIKHHFCSAYGLPDCTLNDSENNSNNSNNYVNECDLKPNNSNENNSYFTDNKNNSDITISELNDELETCVSSDNDLNSSYVKSLKEYVNLGLEKQIFDGSHDKIHTE